MKILLCSRNSDAHAYTGAAWRRVHTTVARSLRPRWILRGRYRTQFRGTSPKSRIVHVYFPRFWLLIEEFHVDWHGGNAMQLHWGGTCFQLPAFMTRFWGGFLQHLQTTFDILPSNMSLPSPSQYFPAHHSQSIFPVGRYILVTFQLNCASKPHEIKWTLEQNNASA